MAANTIEEKFKTLDSKRNQKLQRARAHAELSVPGLLPRQGHSCEQELNVPYNTTAAEGVMALAARMVSVIQPLNNIPFFALQLNEALIPEGEDNTERETQLARFDRRVMDQLGSSNLRSALFTALQHLIVCGDCLVLEKDDYNFQVFRVDQYVVRRNNLGEWREIITQEWVDPEFLPDELQKYKTMTPSAKGGYNDREPVYTEIRYNGSTKQFDVRREFRGQVFEANVYYEVPPYFPLRWTAVTGENYGRSLIEETFGDIRTLDALSKALVEGSILNSEHRWGINPAGITEIADWENSINGDTIPAVNGDIFPIQAENQAQIAITLDAVQRRESRLGRRFLMNAYTQPTGERVTAAQVRVLANELEQTLGGVLSMSAREIQIPIVRRTIYQMARDELLPVELKQLIIDPNGRLKLAVRAGLEALNREVENEKLSMIAEQLKNLPEDAQKVFIWPVWVQRWLSSYGVETTGLVKTQEQVAQEEAMAAQQQRQLMMEQVQLRNQGATQVNG